MLSRRYRLKTRAANFVARRGRSVSGPALRVKWAFSRDSVSRATVVAGLAADKRATKRNLVKRRLREALRFVLPQFRSKVNLMVFANKKAMGQPFEELKKELFFLLKKARLL